MARRVTRSGDSIWVGTTLDNVAENVWVTVSGRDVGDAESEVSLGVDVTAAPEQGGHTSLLVVLSGHVDRGVAHFVSGVDDGAEDAGLEGEVVESVNELDDVCKQESVVV